MDFDTRVNGKTSVYGIIGRPIEHSFSPVLQNSIAVAKGENLIYVPFLVLPKQVQKAVEGAYSLHIQGLNVTVPHKKEVLGAISKLHPLAQQIGAVNTLVYTEDGYHGYNTDVIGLGECIDSHGFTIENKTVIILGAGGAANAALILACSRKAKEVFLVNRTLDHALSLKKIGNTYYNTPITVIGYEEISKLKKVDIAIQTTSVGMGDITKCCIQEESFFEKVKLAVDIVYTPWETRFLKLAKQKGAYAINGFEMLFYQAIASYDIWHHTKTEKEEARKMQQNFADFYHSL